MTNIVHFQDLSAPGRFATRV